MRAYLALLGAGFQRQNTTAGVADLTLEEPDIEDIVRRIYRGETPP